MWLSTSRPRLVFILVPVMVVLLACSLSTAVSVSPTATSTPKPTATPVPHATVVEVSNKMYFPDSKSGGTSAPCANGDPLFNGDCGVAVTVTCPNGEAVLSGGWALDDFLAFVSSSYPSSASAWTITAHDEGQDGQSHPVTVTAYADCLQANFAANTQVVSSAAGIPNDSNYHTKSIGCPGGTTVNGGGFRGSGAPLFSMPSGNGWQASVSTWGQHSDQPTLFAVCANNALKAASTQSASHTFNQFQNGVVSVACPAGQVLVGGGSKSAGAGGSLLADGPANNASQWHVQVRGPTPAAGPGATFTATVYAVCVH